MANGFDLTVWVMIRYRRSYGPLGLLWFALAGILIRQYMVVSLTLGVGESL